ncbi:MAG: UDP-N-acetylmuramoyl-tripeptide--D-alanyl-D-alanine ligase [Anaerovoracaceae bacterium]
MRKYTMKEIAGITGGEIYRGDAESTVDKAFADSRQAVPGGLYFALPGENRDGHEFLKDVLAAGGTAFVISDADALDEAAAGADISAVKVADTTDAMRKLAAHYLLSLDAVRIGITGSTGKTSTKDMMYAVSSVKYKTGRNLGNLNTVQGLCMTILGFDEDIKVAILEMGMDKLGEIHELAGFIRPKIALMTNIGISHIERLGSRDNIFRAKMEIVDYFGPDNTLIISKGPDYLRRENVRRGDYRILMTGEDEDCDYVVSNIRERGLSGISFDITHKGKKQNIDLPVMGRHNALNAALAIAAGGEIGIPMKDAARGLRKMELTGGRLTVRRGRNGITIIDDTYNASPDSVNSAMKTLMKQASDSGRHIAVLGDMFELGENEAEEHRRVGENARELGIDAVITIGSLAENIAEGAGDIAVHFGTKEEFAGCADEYIKQGDMVLVKASHGMHLEEVVRALSEE